MSLRIEIGDVVQLRQLRFSRTGNVLHGSGIKDEHGSPIELPVPNDKQHNSIVWAIDRLRETILLRVDALTPRSMLFNVRFTVQFGRLDACYRALTATQRTLNASPDGWLRSMLFPEPTDGYYQKTLNKVRTELGLHDTPLNYEQRRAVDTVLSETYGPVPYLISGPPGTGKTKTMVELALQLCLKSDSAHLLICAPSDPAADTLVQRLSKQLRPGQLLRLNAPSRSFPEVPNSILAYCCIDDGMFSLPSFEELMRLKLVVTTCRDAEILVRARVTNQDLQYLEGAIQNAIHPGSSHPQPKLHWTGLLIDEAAQATELESLISISVVAPPDEHALKDQQLPIFVMAGDQHQLGPRTASKTCAIQTSLFERLLDRPFYREHPLARSKQTGGVMKRLTQEMLPILRPAFTNLIRNYRSHPAILAIPSKLFYNDTLEPEANDTNRLISLSIWRGSGWPVLFVTNTSSDDVEGDGGGWYNLHEVQIACHYAKACIKSGLLQPHEIVIMSPFRAQVKVLRNIARAEDFAMQGVNIGPLEAFQGLEAPFVIICTTRTRDRFIEQDLARGLGVIHEPKRFNVALTRAKQGLIVIGNPSVLEQDGNWKAFMSFCHRNGLWNDWAKTSWRPRSSEAPVVSRLETALRRREDIGRESEQQTLANGVRHLGVEDEDTALWSSGIAAAEAVSSNGAE